MKYKALRSKITHEWVRFFTDIPDGYAFTSIPELLNTKASIDDLKGFFPEINFDDFELITINLTIESNINEEM